MSKVRLGIVGLGNIGKFHTGYLLEGKISRCELTAVSDVGSSRVDLQACKLEYSIVSPK